MTPGERRMLARLKRGPAALSSLAWAGRVRTVSVKALLSRIRRKAGVRIVAEYGEKTYRLVAQDGSNRPGNLKRE